MRGRNHYKVFCRVVCLILLTVGASGASAQDRLRIELLPVYVMPSDLEDTQSAIEQAILSTNDAFVATRQAMAILGVLSHEYDVVLSEQQYEVLTCTQFEPSGTDTQCTHEGVGSLTADQMGALYQALGYTTTAIWWRPQRTILLMVIMKPDNFLWGGGHLGVASSAFWGGYQADTAHWSTASCGTWSHLLVNSIAHELGHCFGLDHNGAGDSNFDGVDNSFDVMQATRYLYADADWLKPSNQQKVRRHFRDLEEDVPPVSYSLAPARTNTIVD